MEATWDKLPDPEVLRSNRVRLVATGDGASMSHHTVIMQLYAEALLPVGDWVSLLDLKCMKSLRTRSSKKSQSARPDHAVAPGQPNFLHFNLRDPPILPELSSSGWSRLMKIRPSRQEVDKLTIMSDVIVNEYAQGVKSMTLETRQFD